MANNLREFGDADAQPRRDIEGLALASDDRSPTGSCRTCPASLDQTVRLTARGPDERRRGVQRQDRQAVQRLDELTDNIVCLGRAARSDHQQP